MSTEETRLGWTEEPHLRGVLVVGLRRSANALGALWESFVEKVSYVRRRVTVDGKAAAPGESLEFLTLIQGWQSEVREKRLEQLLLL